MTLTKEQIADLEIILDELASAFSEAEENDSKAMTLTSCVGSKFHDRVIRLYYSVLIETGRQGWSRQDKEKA